MSKRKNHIYAAILAGGSGTRFWPLSRELDPKQFFRPPGGRSLICQTIDRVAPMIDPGHLVIVTGEQLHPEIRNHLLCETQPVEDVDFVIEPVARNTAPAIGLLATALYNQDKEAIAVVLPSDHLITNEEKLREAIATGVTLAAGGHLVTIGLDPHSPETGFGYIKAGEELDTDGGLPANKVDRFVEKPDRTRAEEMVASGDYFWNAGMFVFKCSVMLEQMKKHAPDLVETLKWFSEHPRNMWTSDHAREILSDAKSISIDHAVIEKASNVAVIPADLGWSDVGSFTALESMLEHDDNGNVLVGNTIALDTKNSIAYADRRLIALLGLEDVVVIDTHDATLVMHKDQAQEVRRVVDAVKESGRTEHLQHRTSVRPWGSFTVLEEGQGFKTKIIEVNVGGRLSYQFHRHRSEHWVVLTGSAKVTRDSDVQILHPNESTFIPSMMPHRLENNSDVQLRIIEVQSGDYLGEDDIVRLSDEYNRADKD